MRFRTQQQQRKLLQTILISISRVLKGYLISAVLGIFFGSLIGMYQPVKELLVPIITVIRQIPMIAWIPLIVLWCGIGETSKVVIIVLIVLVVLGLLYLIFKKDDEDEVPVQKDDKSKNKK